jgi:hypothetical protein
MGRTQTSNARCRIRQAAGVGAVAAVHAHAACSGGDDDSAQVAGDSSAEGASATTVQSAARAAAPAPAAAESPQDQTAPVAAGEALAITARATLRAQDVQAAVDRISTTVTAHGGRITAADVHHAPDGDEPSGSRATLVLAVPPDQLAAVRGALDDVGEVLSYEQQAEDVAKQLTDLASRITNQRASIARIRELYTSATDLEAIVRIEAELTDRETTLEQLLASQAALEGRVAMATLTVEIAPAPAQTVPADDDPGLGDALAGGWNAFAGALFAVVLVLTAAMPFVLTALAVGVVVLWVLRRVRRPQAVRQPDPAPLREEVAAASHPE